MSNYTLVIVESPAKAHTIGRYLGKSYRVIASQGHVRDLPKSQLGVDVEKDFEPKYITIRGRGNLIADIRREAKGAKKILLATDPDREGEAISWHLCTLLGLDPSSPCRVEFNEITKKAVKAALAAPRSINLELVDAQQARRVLDRLVGYKISPILWAKVKKGLSAGRVQSVATRLVVEREEEIDAFVPEEYWLIDAAFQSGKTRFDAQFWGVGGDRKELKTRQEAEDIVSIVSGKPFSVSDIKTSTRLKSPSAPFTTASLQQDASRKLNFTASKTMQIAQQLYEGVEVKGEGAIGLVTYIRTDSTRISDEAVEQVRKYIAENYPPEYLPDTPNVYKTRQGAQDAHEAIRPSVLELSPDTIKASLTNDQYKLYRLIYNRFVACQMTPAAYDTMTADIKCGDVVFRHSSQKKSFSGFTAIYEEGTDDENAEKSGRIPKLGVSDPCQALEIAPSQRFTQPPARYTEALLVKTLEEKGIGRPSTYAPTISTILGRGYVAREKKRLFPTELGKIVTSVMSKAFPDIVDTEFTAQMETQLDEIAEGELKWQNVISGFYYPFEQELTEAEKQLEKVEIAPEVSEVSCPNCGAMLVYRKGRFGKFLACPNFPDCRYTQTLLTYIDAPCPKCGKRLIERINKKGRKFYGCEDYPTCDFVSWDMPVKEACPKCGGYMTLKYLRGGATARVCQNESCRYREEVKTEETDE